MPVSKNLKKNFVILKFLSDKKVPNTIKQKILTNPDDKLVLAVCECVLNVCHHTKCDKKIIKRLKKFKKQIYCLSNTKRNEKNLSKQKKVLKQHGGSIIPLLLSTAFSLLSPYLLNIK